VVGMKDSEDKHSSHTCHHKHDLPGVFEGEPACPQEQTTYDKADGDAEDVDEAESVQNMREDVDEKDSGKEAGNVVVPLHIVTLSEASY
jgi:hypothetical protein